MYHPEQESRNVYQQLYVFLTHEYWKVQTVEAKNDIRECADLIFDTLNRLAEDESQPGTDSQQLKASAQSILAKLEKLRQDGLAHNVPLDTYVQKVLEIIEVTSSRE